MVYNVSINAHLTFGDKAAARFAAQSIELIASTAKHVGGAPRITDLDTGLGVSVHEPVVDRSKHVRGFQATEELVRKYMLAIEKRADGTAEPDFWQGLFDVARTTGQVNYAMLTDLAATRFGLSDETTRTILGDIVAEVAAAAAQREYNTAVTPPKKAR